jgi:Domain of Unknown Function (DUF1540)
MKMMIEMPNVEACEVTSCAYNADQACHARAITVGHGIHAACDTFFVAQPHASSDQHAGVGACKVAACRHNHDYECAAAAIRVGLHQDHADCMTFDAR